VLIIVGVVILAGGGYFGFRHWHESKAPSQGKEPPMRLSPAGKQVGSIDRDALFKLPEFVEIDKAMKQKTKEMDTKFRQEAQKLLGTSRPTRTTPEQDRALKTIYIKMEMDLQQMRNQLMSPLLQKMEAAVAVTALKRNMNAVLDKRIVVYGAPDITQEVKDLMQKQKEITAPTEKPKAPAQIGYFNQQVIRNLPMFRDLDASLSKLNQDMIIEFNRRAVKLKNDAERSELATRMKQAFDMKKNERLGPLLKKVSDTVEETAKEQGLVLVLDQENVMYGGVNLTDAVTKKLLLKKK
jgi:outer membrane protein